MWVLAAACMTTFGPLSNAPTALQFVPPLSMMDIYAADAAEKFDWNEIPDIYTAGEEGRSG